MAHSHTSHLNSSILSSTGNGADKLCQQLKGFSKNHWGKKKIKFNCQPPTLPSIRDKKQALGFKGVIKPLTIHLTWTPLAILVKSMFVHDYASNLDGKLLYRTRCGRLVSLSNGFKLPIKQGSGHRCKTKLKTQTFSPSCHSFSRCYEDQGDFVLSVQCM